MKKERKLQKKSTIYQLYKRPCQVLAMLPILMTLLGLAYLSITKNIFANVQLFVMYCSGLSLLSFVLLIFYHVVYYISHQRYIPLTPKEIQILGIEDVESYFCWLEKYLHGIRPQKNIRDNLLLAAYFSFDYPVKDETTIKKLVDISIPATDVEKRIIERQKNRKRYERSWLSKRKFSSLSKNRLLRAILVFFIISFLLGILTMLPFIHTFLLSLKIDWVYTLCLILVFLGLIAALGVAFLIVCPNIDSYNY